MLMRQREPRRKVMIRARMRSGADWSDVSIHNMSSRGLLATSDVVCRPGTVIEIRRIHHIIVGRVVWQNGAYFGVRTQDRIDIDGIIAAKPPARKPGTDTQPSNDDRRATRRQSVGEREAASRRFAARFQFVTMIVVIGIVSLIAAQAIGGVLSRPFEAIRAHLGAE